MVAKPPPYIVNTINRLASNGGATTLELEVTAKLDTAAACAIVNGKESGESNDTPRYAQDWNGRRNFGGDNALDFTDDTNGLG